MHQDTMDRGNPHALHNLPHRAISRSQLSDLAWSAMIKVAFCATTAMATRPIARDPQRNHTEQFSFFNICDEIDVSATRCGEQDHRSGLTSTLLSPYSSCYECRYRTGGITGARPLQAARPHAD
jgi:hypothetical protein